MASKYWIKLYHEILDDPKMGKLPDKLWRRAIEFFLLAGDVDGDGDLPPLTDMAWRLRIPEDELQRDLEALATIGVEIVTQERDETSQDGNWFVTKFVERQAAMSGSERMERFRDAKRKEKYYGDEGVTKRHTSSDEDVTNTQVDIDIDTDIDKKRSENEKNSFSSEPRKIYLTPDEPIKERPKKVYLTPD